MIDIHSGKRVYLYDPENYKATPLLINRIIVGTDCYDCIEYQFSMYPNGSDMSGWFSLAAWDPKEDKEYGVAGQKGESNMIDIDVDIRTKGFGLLGQKWSHRRYQKLDELCIEKVIFNHPATIIFWSDGSKTVVKCSRKDDFDPEKGLAMAICKKIFGNKGNYNRKMKKWLPNDAEGDKE